MRNVIKDYTLESMIITTRFICYIKQLLLTGPKAYFTGYWNYVNLLIIALSALTCVSLFIRNARVDKELDGILIDPPKFRDFTRLMSIQQQFEYSLIALLFVVYIKAWPSLSISQPSRG